MEVKNQMYNIKTTRMNSLKFFGILLLVAFSMNMQAQEGLKLAHIDSQELLSMMPEADSARAALEREQKSIQTQLEEMQVEFNNKYNDYVTRADSMSDFIRQSKEEELQSLQERIRMFEANAQQNLQQQRSKMFQPIIDKAQRAIDKVAAENGYDYVFDISAGSVIFQSDRTVDLMPLVKEELGLE